jgi:hypothetical protein
MLASEAFNATKLEHVDGPSEVQEAAAVVGTLAIGAAANVSNLAIGGELPEEDIGYQWSLTSMDQNTRNKVVGVQWSFAPWPIVRFTANQVAGRAVNLEWNDLAGNPIDFACHAPLTLVKSTAPGYAPAASYIQSRSPNHIDCEVTSRGAEVFINKDQETWLRLGGGKAGDVGIHITFTAEPNGAEGELAGIQLVKSIRIFEAKGEHFESVGTGATWALDLAAKQESFLYLNRCAPLPGPLQISDSPAQQLEDPFIENDFIAFEVNEMFRTWIMFRSATPGANWMPLYRLEWGWNAVARRGDTGEWQLSRQDVFPPVRTATLEFPAWTTNVTQYKWQKM